MSTAEDPERPPAGRSSPDPRRPRLLIAGVVLGVVVFVIAFMLLVSQCGTDSETEIYGSAAGVATTATSAVQ
jgi:hypothetical protein